MKRSVIATFTVAAATTLLSPPVRADFLQIDLEYAGLNPFGDQYRVYAMFDEGDEVVTALVGTENNAMILTSLNSAGDGPGCGFYNAPSGQDTPVFGFFYTFDPVAAAADTYVTIGLESAADDPLDAAAFSPGFQAQLGGLVDSFTAGTPNGTYFVTPDAAQAEVAPGPFGLYRVFLANITVKQGENIQGRFNIQWATSIGGGGGLESAFFPAFNPGVPCISDISSPASDPEALYRVDGVTDSFDLLAVIENWGACPPAGPCEFVSCPGDIVNSDGDATPDGAVDVFDLLAVLEDWGACCPFPPSCR